MTACYSSFLPCLQPPTSRPSGPTWEPNLTTDHKRIVILGSTGSIGCQTLDVIRSHPDRFEVLGLACNSSWNELVDQIDEFNVPAACVCDSSSANRPWPTSCERLPYPEGLVQLASHADADIIVLATVGEAGFLPAEAALRTGNTVALASKELLVMGGQLFRDLADSTGARILPIDSEHSAVWQCLAGEEAATIRRLILTASGGPFRQTDLVTLRDATAEEALRHPNWVMGPKITTDSASLMNKGLEVIEAHWLFGLPYDAIDVIIHPESIVHSIVEFRDGSLKAQLGTADMRLPIQYALGYPERLNSAHSNLSLGDLAVLRFEDPDYDRFPLLQAAMEAGRAGGTAPATLCGADDAAVEMFLRGDLRFGQMVDAILDTMAVTPVRPLASFDAALGAHQDGANSVRRRASRPS